jgi:uncharacterized protein YbjQ (UPF0145 family)
MLIMSQREAAKDNLLEQSQQDALVSLVNERITQFKKMATALQKLSSNKAKQFSKSFLIQATHLEEELRQGSIESLEKEIARMDIFVERTKEDAVRRLRNRADSFKANATRLLERKTSRFSSFDYRELSEDFLKQVSLFEAGFSEKSYYKIEKTISEADEFFNAKKSHLLKIDKRDKKEKKGRVAGKQLQKMASTVGIAVFTLLILILISAIIFVVLPELLSGFSSFWIKATSRW